MKRRKTKNPEIVEKLEQLKEAVQRFSEIVKEPEDKMGYIRDASIQRFEFSFELCWKTINKLLRYITGFDVTSPKATLQKAYAEKWIDDQKIWTDMLEDRNMLSHAYKETEAKRVYKHLKKYSTELSRVYNFMKELFENYEK